MKVGADAPETLLAYADFDGTNDEEAGRPAAHLRAARQDWVPGDPVWKDGKGKG